MRPRQFPSRWLFADERLGDALWPTLRSLPRGSGIVVMFEDDPDRAKLLRRIGRHGQMRGLVVVDGTSRHVARIHDSSELTRALARGAELLFVSSIHETRSHPGRKPLPRMRAAALARLAPGSVFALGGMDKKRFRAIRPLGFDGWGGIDAWRRKMRPSREQIP